MSRAQLRRLAHLEERKRAILSDRSKVLIDSLLERFGMEELDQIESYNKGNRSPGAVEAWSEWEALLHSDPEMGKRVSHYNVAEWWRSWADVWQRA